MAQLVEKRGKSYGWGYLTIVLSTYEVMSAIFNELINISIPNYKYLTTKSIFSVFKITHL